MTGTVTRVFEDRGFGFIKPAGSDHQRGIFFHCREVNGMPFDGQLVERLVEFDVTETDKGTAAVNVRPIQ